MRKPGLALSRRGLVHANDITYFSHSGDPHETARDRIEWVPEAIGASLFNRSISRSDLSWDAGYEYDTENIYIGDEADKELEGPLLGADWRISPAAAAGDSTGPVSTPGSTTAPPKPCRTARCSEILHFDKEQVDYFAGRDGANRWPKLRGFYAQLLAGTRAETDSVAWFNENVPAARKLTNLRDDEVIFLLEIARLEGTPLSRHCTAYGRCIKRPDWPMRALWLKGQLEPPDPASPALRVKRVSK